MGIAGLVKKIQVEDLMREHNFSYEASEAIIQFYEELNETYQYFFGDIDKFITEYNNEKEAVDFLGYENIQEVENDYIILYLNNNKIVVIE